MNRFLILTSTKIVVKRLINRSLEIILQSLRSHTMIKKFVVIFILLSNVSFSQNLPKPTQFDTFITKPNIEWAAYANDTIRFEEKSFNKLLFQRMEREEIKVSLPVWSGSNDANYISYLKKDSLNEEVLYPLHRFGSMIDSNGNNILPSPPIEPFKIDTTAFTVTDVTQILYIAGGKLKSYVPWVSPRMIPITLSNGHLLGYNAYFSTCFNYKYDQLPGKKNKISFLTKTNSKLRLDTSNGESKLKELYGRNLIETLWPYISGNKIELFSVETDKRIKEEEINALIKNPAFPIPAFDSLGLIYTGYMGMNFDLKLFTEIELAQDWYYDHTGNIVFNRIKELYLYAKKWTKNEEDKKSSPVLKIVFN